MRFFDCDIAYGRGAVALPREIETAADVIAEMDHSGIAEALVWHRDAWERDFDAGNRRLDEVRAHPRLHPTWTFVPTCCEEMPGQARGCSPLSNSAEAFICAARAAGACGLRAFPIRHCFLMDRVSCGDLLDACEAYGMPVFVPLAEMPGGWDGVYRLLRDFPRLPLVLTETGCWGQDRYFRPLMKEYPRFFITTNRLETAGQLESIVHHVGPDHLLFGSGLPRNYAGGYILMILRAHIADDARQAIAYGNIELLLKEIAP